MSDGDEFLFDYFSNVSSDEGTSFFKEKIWNQKRTESDDNVAESVNRLTHNKKPTLDGQANDQYAQLLDLAKSLVDGTNSDSQSVVEKANGFISGKMQEDRSNKEMTEILNELKKQVGGLYKELGLEAIDVIAFYYYVEIEDARKTPSWKRRAHRFCPSFDVETAYDLHDALYLAELSYADTVEQVKDGLSAFVGAPWEMIYCTVKGGPREPAHFLCLKKESENEAKSKGWNFPWLQDESALDVLLVIRGTKEISDVVSDLLMEASDYRGGRAHNGIQESGAYLVNKHLPLLKRLLEESKRKKIRLSLIGHSLGAGAAAIAAMEFNEHEFIEAKSVGFGCPALLSKDLSESVSDYITTVVCDADIVPRMSGATVCNMLLDMMSIDYIDNAILDVTQMVDAVNDKLPFDLPTEKRAAVAEWMRNALTDRSKSIIESSKLRSDRMEVVLFPPGKCIHLYRDGVGISGCYVPCTFFNEVDVSRTMVEDHLVPPGYNKLLHELMRDHLGMINFRFRNEIGVRLEQETQE